jgi:uncharacterized RDD family membrane protein YckC
MLTAGKSQPMDKEPRPVNGTAKWVAPATPRLNVALDTTMRVTTPENISFHYQVTGPFRRVFAYGLDLLISLGSYGAFVLLVYLLFWLAILPLASRFGNAAFIEALMGMLGGMVLVGYFVVYWFYGAYMETYFNGQTLGKRITNMRVISTNGHAIDGVQAILRNFFRLLDIGPYAPLAAMFQMDQQLPGFLPTCLFGVLVMTLNRKFQRIGDLVAGTVVVNEDLKQRPNLATFLDERVPQLAELIPTSFVVPASMAGTVADYVDQRKFLPFQRASEIAAHLAVPLMEKMGIAHDTDKDLFLCALYYKTFIASEIGDKETGASFSPAIGMGLSDNVPPPPTNLETSTPLTEASLVIAPQRSGNTAEPTQSETEIDQGELE